jgi:nicotinamidase-related amidase
MAPTITKQRSSKRGRRVDAPGWLSSGEGYRRGIRCLLIARKIERKRPPRTFSATAIPNMRRLQSACREAGIKVIYTVIESLTYVIAPKSLRKRWGPQNC